MFRVKASMPVAACFSLSSSLHQRSPKICAGGRTVPVDVEMTGTATRPEDSCSSFFLSCGIGGDEMVVIAKPSASRGTP